MDMLAFVTSNDAKVAEAEAVLDRPIEHVAYDYPERQAASVRAVATAGAETAYAALDRPVIVDDTGLSIAALDGFPGPYAAYVEETLGIETVSELAAGSAATFVTALGCVVPGTVESVDVPTIETTTQEDYTLISLLGTVSGTIVPPRGDNGFGYDPIFEVDGRTLAERSRADKAALSHRGEAFERFGTWLERVSIDPVAD